MFKALNDWLEKRRERQQKERELTDRFQALLHEADENRGDLSKAVDRLRQDREEREVAQSMRSRLPSKPAHQE